MTPRVTVGLPVYDDAATLEAAVRSIFAQTFRDWELILVDDGSSDGSERLAARIDDARVTFVRDGRNRGLGARLNEITGRAAGEYLARMDADDVMHPDRLARQVAFLDEHPEVDVVGTGVYGIDGDDRVLNVRAVGPVDTSPRSVLLGRGLFVHPTVTGRTDWFRRNPYDEDSRRMEDRHLWSRTCRTSRFARIGEPLLFYREDGSLDGWDFARKYLRSTSERSELLRRHGQGVVSGVEARLAVAGGYAKTAVHFGAAALGLHSRLFSLRGPSPDEEGRKDAESALERVHATPVPGWEEGSG